MTYNQPVRLGDILTFKRGYDLTAGERVPGPYPVFSSAGITGYHNEYKVSGEAVITGRTGTIGEPYYFLGKYWPHNTSLYVKDFKDNDPRYIFYLLKCLGNLLSSGKSTVPGVDRNDLHELKIPFIKSKSSQIAIRNVLWPIDQKLDFNKKIISNLEELAQTIFKYWFVQFDFPDQDGRPYKSSGGKMIFDQHLKREKPSEWVTTNMDHLLEHSVTGLNPRNHFELGVGNNYYVTIRHIENGKLNLGNNCDTIDDRALQLINQRSQLEVGDILFTSIEPVGLVYLIQQPPKNWNINESVFSLRPNKNLVTSEFLYFLLQSDFVKTFSKNVAAGSVHKGIRHELLKSLELAVPSKKLIKSFTDHVSPILKSINIYEKDSGELEKLRDWLLPILMNGKLEIQG